MPVSVQDQLTSSVWTSLVDYEDLDMDGVFVAFGDACDQDNTMEFRPDGVLVHGSGPTLCDGESPDDFLNAPNANWQLENGDQILKIEFPFDEVRYQIVSMTDHEAILNLVDPSLPSGTYDQRIVLRR